MHQEFLYSLASPLLFVAVVVGVVSLITNRTLGKPNEMMRETRQRLDDSHQEQQNRYYCQR